MEQGITGTNNLTAAEKIETPHFDEEQTLLSARPVVPLSRLHRKWVDQKLLLGAAFLLAMTLGAGAALALARLTRYQTQTATKSSTDEMQPLQATSVTNGNEVAQQEAKTPSEDNSSAVATANSQPDAAEPGQHVSKNAKRTRRSPKTEPDVSFDRVDNSSDQPILVDEWQERRPRRVIRDVPESRNHRRRDLFRIRDIFEGQRPQ